MEGSVGLTEYKTAPLAAAWACFYPSRTPLGRDELSRVLPRTCRFVVSPNSTAGPRASTCSIQHKMAGAWVRAHVGIPGSLREPDASTDRPAIMFRAN